MLRVINIPVEARSLGFEKRPPTLREITSGAIGRLLLNSRVAGATESVASNQSGTDGKEGAHPHRRWHRRDGVVSPVLI